MWVGKEYADMRQNERRIEFLRAGDVLEQWANIPTDPGEKTLFMG